MSRRHILTCAAWLLGIAASPYSLAAEAGQQAQEFRLPGAAAGSTVSLQSLAGKVVYVDFWASWCGPCRQSFPWLGDMQKRYADKGLVVVGINVDKKREDADKFLAQTPAAFTLAFDSAGATPKAWAVKGMPSSYIVGRDGKILMSHTGFRESEREELESKIKSALAAGAAK